MRTNKLVKFQDIAVFNLNVIFHLYRPWSDGTVYVCFQSGGLDDPVHFTGSVAEWSKALVLGTSLNEAWVRIPPLPGIFFTQKMVTSLSP